MHVRFLITDTPYQAGQEYDLPDAEAEKFVRHEVAELTDADATGTTEPLAPLPPTTVTEGTDT